jgi:hypothetical protein
MESGGSRSVTSLMLHQNPKDYARAAETSLLCRAPRDHVKISLNLKGFVRGLDQPMPTFRLPTEQQPDVMPCIPSLPSGP